MGPWGPPPPSLNLARISAESRQNHNLEDFSPESRQNQSTIHIFQGWTKFQQKFQQNFKNISTKLQPNLFYQNIWSKFDKHTFWWTLATSLFYEVNLALLIKTSTNNNNQIIFIKILSTFDKDLFVTILDFELWIQFGNRNPRKTELRQVWPWNPTEYGIRNTESSIIVLIQRNTEYGHTEYGIRNTWHHLGSSI